MSRRRKVHLGALACSLSACAVVLAQTFTPPPVDPPAQSNSTFSVAERKLTTPLRLALRAANADQTPDANASADRADAVSRSQSNDPLKIEIACVVNADLIHAIESLRGVVVEQSARWGVIIATVPASAVLAIAERDDVRRVKLPSRPRVNAP